LQLTGSTKRKPSLAGGIILAVGAFVILLGYLQAYYVASSGDADLFWKSDTAYLVVSGERRGYHVSYLGYLAGVTKAFLAIQQAPDDVHPFTDISRITPSGIQRFEENRILSFFTPLGQDLYAWDSDAHLLKWSVSRFEPATAEERRKFPQYPSLPPKAINDVDGWSVRYSITNGPSDPIHFNLDRAPVTILVRWTSIIDGQVSITVSIHDRSSEEVFRRTGKPQRVSGREYELAFPDNSSGHF
jgi:hypothetical protein